MPSQTEADSFDTIAGLHPDLLRAVREMGFTRPTPIQALAVGPILSGQDLVATAQTGSGKTLGYLLPCLSRMLARMELSPDAGSAKPHTRMLVLVPTRELALQVETVAKDLARFSRVRTCSVFGGVGMEPQTKALRSGVEVVAATPGRLLDHLGVGNAKLGSIECLVLDEADRMLDIGFLPDIRRIVERLPKERQTLLFSATMPTQIVELARSIQRGAAHVSAGEVLTKPKIPKGIAHKFYPVPTHQKLPLLLRILADNPTELVLVFTQTKARADMLCAALQREGVSVAAIHSDLSQADRFKAMNAFRDRKVKLLVATDIASRGIDIEEISHVVNYDVPQTAEDYVHRVGRTGRAEATGEAVTLVSLEEMRMLTVIEAEIGHPVPRLSYPGFSGGGAGGNAPAGTEDGAKGTGGPHVYVPPRPVGYRKRVR